MKPLVASLLLVLAAWLPGALRCHGQEITPTPHARFVTGADVTTLGFSLDQARLLAGDADGRVHVWDLASGEPVSVSRLEGAVAFAAPLPGDTTFVAVSRGGQVAVHTLGGTSREVHAAASRIEGAALDALGRYLALRRADGQVEIRNVENGARLGMLETRDRLREPVFVGFDALGQQLAAISARGEALFWNPVTQRVLRQTTLGGGEHYGSRSKVHVIGSRPDAGVLVAGIEEVALPQGGVSARARPGDLVRRDVVVAYDWERAMEVARVEIPDGQVTALAVGPGPDHVVVARRRQQDVLVLDLREGRQVAALATEEVPTVLAVSGNDQWLAAGLPSGGVVVWALPPSEAASELRAGERLPALSGRIRVVGEPTPLLPSVASATVAVLPFEGRGAAQDWAPAVADILTTGLANLDALTLVERIRIDALLDELALREQGITRDDGVQIGRMLQADYVVLGSVDAFERSYLLNARLLNVETAEVVGGRQVVCEACRTADFVDAVMTLSATLAERDE